MKEINTLQKNLYEGYDINGCKRYLSMYSKYLDRFSGRNKLMILDIGGASGHFAYLLKEYFQGVEVEVYVVDSTSYDSWDTQVLGTEVHFICDSVENLNKLFYNNTFDIVFANRVFHHFIDRSWRKSLKGMEKHLATIKNILKPDGALCIMDHFYDGIIIDSATSCLIYTLTSINNPVISKLIKKLGAMTAGVGVCFQSEKMWVRRVTKTGFNIVDIDKSIPDRLNPIKKCFLLCKKLSRNNIIFATPSK